MYVHKLDGNCDIGDKTLGNITDSEVFRVDQGYQAVYASKLPGLFPVNGQTNLPCLISALEHASSSKYTSSTSLRPCYLYESMHDHLNI